MMVHNKRRNAVGHGGLVGALSYRQGILASGDLEGTGVPRLVCIRHRVHP